MKYVVLITAVSFVVGLASLVGQIHWDPTFLGW